MDLRHLATNEKIPGSTPGRITNMVPSASGLSHRTFYARTPVRIREGLLNGILGHYPCPVQQHSSMEVT